MVLTDRPILTLADLEAHDPNAPSGQTERRFLCPLPPCAGHQRRADHRSLAVNVASGAWVCHRCTAAGKLRERWSQPRDRAQQQLRRAFSVHQPPAKPEAPVSGSTWPMLWLDSIPLAGSPGADYLAERGIVGEIGSAAHLRYARDFYGRPAVLFPVCDRAASTMVAVIGRYIDGRTDPKGRAAGPKSAGVFWTPGALTSEQLVITEAPIDALSLGVAGVPAIALGGTSAPDWLPMLAALRSVVIALDADDAGDAAAQRLAVTLAPLCSRIERWRPDGKDWNATLLTYGADALRDALAHHTR